MSRPEFVYAIYIEAPQAKVWEALTKGEHTKQYWSRFVRRTGRLDRASSSCARTNPNLVTTAKCWRSIRRGVW